MSTQELKGVQGITRAARMIVVATLAQYSRYIKEWAECCAMFTNTEPFSKGAGAAYEAPNDALNHVWRSVPSQYVSPQADAKAASPMCRTHRGYVESDLPSGPSPLSDDMPSNRNHRSLLYFPACISACSVVA